MSQIRPRLLPILSLASMSALATALSAPGPGLWPLAFFSLVPWAVATERAAAARRSWIVDYIWGVVFFGVIVYYLIFITPIAYIPVVVIAPLFVVLAGFVYRGLRRRLPASVALPLAWLCGEVVRTIQPFHYPWDLLGYSAAGWLDFAGIASVGGVFLVSLVLAFINGACVDALRSAGRTRWVVAGLAAVVTAAVAISGGALRRDVGVLRSGPRLLCIQPNVSQDLKEEQESFARIWARMLVQVEQSASLQPDLLVISETMLPTPVVRDLPDHFKVDDYLTAADYRRLEKQNLQHLRAAAGPGPWILTGALLYDRASLDVKHPLAKNSALLFDPEGLETARYDKLYLVPGGEAIPMIPEGAVAQWIRDAINPFTHGMVPDLIPGNDARAFEFRPRRSASGASQETIKFGVSICYDNAFSRPFIEPAGDGAQFHVVLSNEGWFPNESWEMDAMLAYSAFRAIETRRAIVRCTNTGITCLVDPDGRLAAMATRNGKRAGFAGEFDVRPPLSSARTIYVTIGDLPFYVLAGVAVLAALALSRTRQTSKAAG